MPEKILVATDGSHPADRAVGVAIDIARARGAELVLLSVREGGTLPDDLRHLAEVEHVVDSGASLPNAPAWLIDSLRRAKLEAEDEEIHAVIAHTALANASDRVAKAGLTTPRAVEEKGDVAKAIVTVATREDAAMIVMGCRGLGAVREWIEGSVSKSVARKAPCPCVIVT